MSTVMHVQPKSFLPDYHHMLDVLANRRPARLPVYEHIIAPQIIETVLDVKLSGLLEGGPHDQDAFFRHYCRFFQEMTYDTVSFEMTIVDELPDHGAIFGGRPGPIQNWADFERYPWDELPELYWKKAEPQFQALARCLPPGMKALGGVGNGVLEISEDLVGFERLAYVLADEPELFTALYHRIGDLMINVWTRFRHLPLRRRPRVQD
jgi:uroporphyrinogen decarboxylase